MFSTSLDRRRFLRMSGLALGGAAALAACGGGESGSGNGSSGGSQQFPNGTVNLQLSWIKNVEFAGEYFADALGYYKAQGFEGVNLQAGGSASTGVETNLVSGACWAGLSAPVLTAPAIVQGAPLKIVGATFQKNPFCIVSLAEKGITEPGQLAGKRIGVQDANDNVWTAFLKANNIDPASVTRVPVQFDPTPVTTGEVDGFVAYLTNEPNSLKVRGFETATLSFADNGFPLTAETVTVLQDTLDAERDKVKAFLRAEIMGWRDALADPSEAARLAVEVYGKDLNLDRAEQELEMQSQILLVNPPDAKPDGLFNVSDALVEENLRSLSLAGINVTAEQLFDLSLVKEIYSEDPSLKV
jgi:ABC-type nitrate/sulfonate/bicarbonate transport system substrate-binding protein